MEKRDAAHASIKEIEVRTAKLSLVMKHATTYRQLNPRANTETFGVPSPTEVPLTVEKGPFIVITAVC